MNNPIDLCGKAAPWNVAFGHHLIFSERQEIMHQTLLLAPADDHIDILVTYLGITHAFSYVDFFRRLGFLSLTLGDQDGPAS